MKKIIFALSILFLLATNAHATVWFVDITATGAGNGTSWVNAYTNLQPAIDTAQNGDQIWVRGFTTTNSSLVYRPTYDSVYGPSFNFYDSNNPHLYQYFRLRGRSIKIYGGFEGTEVSLNDRKEWATYRSFLGTYADSTAYLINMNGTEVTLDGFFIEGTITTHGTLVLGGMQNQVLAHLKIKGNTTGTGSIIAVESSSYTNSLVRMFNVEISNNPFPLTGSGHLIHVCSASLELYNVTIANNQWSNTSVPSFTTEKQCEFHIYNSIIYRTYGFSLANNGISNVSATNCIDTRTNPGFVNVNPITGDYHLMAGSNAIDAGDIMLYYDAYNSTLTPVQNPFSWERDLDGLSRWVDDEIDLGAYEYLGIMFAPRVDNGESEETVFETDLTDRLEEVSLNATIMKGCDVIQISNLKVDAIIRTYSINGSCVSTQNSSTHFTAPEHAGTYIVTINESDGTILYKGKIVVMP